MALDPSISLGYKPPQIDFLDTATKGMKLASMGQAIEASKAEQALTEAQTPGAVADSAVKTRANEYVNWLKDNKKNFTDENGNVDTLKLTAASTDAGYGDSARAVATHDLAAAGTKITNATSQQALDQARLDYKNKAAGHTANLILDPSLSEDQAGALVKKATDFANQSMPGLGDQVAGLLTKQVPVLDKDGNPTFTAGPQGPVPVTKTVVDKDAAKNVARATMDINTQQTQALAKQNQAATLERMGQSPEAYDTNSSLTKMAIQSLAKNGIEAPAGATYRDLLQTYGAEKLSSLATNDVVSQEYRLGVKEKAAAAQTDISNINTIQKAAKNYGQPLLGTTIGTFGSKLYEDHIKKSPELAGLITGVQAYNARFPDDKIDMGKLNVAQILEKMDQWKAMRTNDLKTNLNNMGPNINTGTQPGGGQVEPQPQPQVQAGTPSTGAGIVPPKEKPPAIRSDGKVLMEAPSGKKYHVAPNEVQQAVNNGWKVTK